MNHCCGCSENVSLCATEDPESTRCKRTPPDFKSLFFFCFITGSAGRAAGSSISRNLRLYSHPKKPANNSLPGFPCNEAQHSKGTEKQKQKQNNRRDLLFPKPCIIDAGNPQSELHFEEATQESAEHKKGDCTGMASKATSARPLWPHITTHNTP